MIDTRVKKMFQNLWFDPGRTLIVILAIAIGIFCVGIVITSLSLLDRETNANYMNSNPASAVLLIDHADDSLINIVKSDTAIRDAEVRRTLTTRALAGPDRWQTTELIVIDNFSDMRIGTIYPKSGSWPAGRGEILFDASSLPKTGKNIGDRIVVQTYDGTSGELHIDGTVYDASLTPANIRDSAYGYISKETLDDLNGSSAKYKLMITVAEDGANISYIKSVAYRLKDRLAQAGYGVTNIDVPTPGVSPVVDAMSQLIFLFGTFGILTLFLSMILTVNMVTGLLSQQVRQVGMMKAVGATTGQVMAIYLGGVFVLGIAATAIAVPASVLAGQAVADMVVDSFNLVSYSNAVPVWIFAVLIGIGLLAPVIAAIFPVYRGCRITVHEAINDYGIDGGENAGSGALVRLLGQVPGLSRPTLLAIRNTFRRRERMALTLLTLAIGGALFIVAMNVGTSVDATAENMLGISYFDDFIYLANNYPTEDVSRALAGVPGIGQVKYAVFTRASLTGDDGTDSKQFMVVAYPVESDVISFPIIDGRWLQPGDEKAIVLNQVLVRQLKERGDIGDIKAGDSVTLSIGGNRSTWHVVGIDREMYATPRAYVSYDYYTGMTGKSGLANIAFITLADENPSTPDGRKAGDKADGAVPSIERALSDSGMKITTILSINTTRQYLKAHIAVIAVFLTFMSGMMAVVGTLGLVSSMSINVAERRREIGMMRAIGATNRAISGMVAVEAAVIGMLSWLLALVVAMPLGIMIGTAFGMVFFDSPLDIRFSYVGILLWLIIIAILSPAASLLSARKASRRPVHEVLAYE